MQLADIEVDFPPGEVTFEVQPAPRETGLDFAVFVSPEMGSHAARIASTRPAPILSFVAQRCRIAPAAAASPISRSSRKVAPPPEIAAIPHRAPPTEDAAARGLAEAQAGRLRDCPRRTLRMSDDAAATASDLRHTRCALPPGREGHAAAEPMAEAQSTRGFRADGLARGIIGKKVTGDADDA